MRKICFYATVGLLLLLASCSNEQVRSLDATSESATGDYTSIRFQLRAAGGDPVVFTRAGIQTESEIKINRLDVFQFKLDSTGKEMILEESYLDQEFTPVGNGINLTLKVKGSGEKKFVFVANNSGDGSVPAIANPKAGMSLSDFERQATQSIEGKRLSAPLLMVSPANLVEVLADNKTPAQKTELTRTMARLDIKNYEPNLTLKRVRLERVNDRGYLVHQASASQTVDGNKVISLPNIDLPTAVTSGDPSIVMEQVPEQTNASGVVTEAAHVHYKHVCYPYVSDEVSDEAKAPVLIIEGTLFNGDPEREHDVVYHKVLQIDGASSYLGFQRNHRYTVAIEGGKIPGKANISLKVDLWELNENLELPMIEASAPEVIRLVYPQFFVNGDNKYDNDSQVYIHSANVVNTSGRPSSGARTDVLFQVSRNTDWDIVLNGQVITSDEYKVVDQAPWLSVWRDSEDYYANTIYSRSFAAGLWLCFIEANKTGKDREVTLVLRSKVDPTKFSEFRVVQSAQDRVQ